MKKTFSLKTYSCGPTWSEMIGNIRHKNRDSACVCERERESGWVRGERVGFYFPLILEGQALKVACKAHAGR